MKILHLTLKKKPFEVMVTGEKKIEYRKPSKWILSRLVSKEYDYVKFVNGYGKDKPYFIAEYSGFNIVNMNYSATWSDFKVNVKIGDIAILLGTIIEKGNIN
jgi:hypothetical protein